MDFALAPQLLSGFLLAMIRAVAWLLVSPPFGGNNLIPIPVKLGLAGALAVGLGPKLAEMAVPLEPGPLLGAALLQVAIGVALGFASLLVFSAMQAAGEMVDLFSGFTLASVYDPLSNSVVPVFGRFYGLLATTLLFAIDGHLLLLRGFMTSFDAAPVSGLRLDDLAELLTRDLSMFFLAAIEIASPLLAALFLAECVVGLLAKAAPQMNVFMVGLPFKILLAIALTGFALPLLPNALDALLGQMLRNGVATLRAVTGGG